MRTRLADIAARAGVSLSTVSRVLNEKPGVNDQTRAAVLTALDVLGYERPTRLRPKGGGLVGLVMPELENPFFPHFAERLEIGLAKVGYTPVLCGHTLAGLHEDEYVATLLDHSVSGIVFVSGIHAVADSDPGRYRNLIGRGLPVILVNGFQGGIGAACLATDDAAAVHLAVSHLAHMGHRRIGLALGQQRYTPALRKAAAFAGAMRSFVDPDLTDEELGALVRFSAYTLDGGERAAHALLDVGATAVVCASDIMALGAIKACRDRGCRVPADVSVVGTDDSVLMGFVDPPLTTVRQPAAAMAARVCELLVEAIDGQPAPAGEQLFAPELVVRASSGRAPLPVTARDG